MAKFDFIWRGSKDIEERPNSPKFSSSAQGAKCRRVFDGPFDLLVRKQPKIDAKMTGSGALRVETVDIEPDPASGGLVGVMTVVLSVDYAGTEGEGGEVTFDTEGAPQYRREWLEEARDIATHRRYQPDGEDELSEEAWDTLTKARAGDESAINEIAGLSDGPLLKIWSQLKRGASTYIFYYPVITETRYYRAYPHTEEGAGYRDEPPALIPPGDWHWLKTGDNLDRVGTRYALTRQWTGFDYINPDYYPAG